MRETTPGSALRTTLSLVGLIGGVIVGTLSLWFTLSDRVDAKVESAKVEWRQQLDRVQKDVSTIKDEMSETRALIYNLDPELFIPAIRPRVRAWQGHDTNEQGGKQ